jgi:hypothetical protein
MDVALFSETLVLQDPHDATSQKTAFFIEWGCLRTGSDRRLDKAA